MRVKVKRCEEFHCPFYHAGIMGQLECTLAKRSLPTYSEHNYGAIPGFCPLRKEPAKVSL